MTTRERKLERIRRAQARHVPPIVAAPSGQDRTAEVVAWCLRLLDRDAHSGGSSAPWLQPHDPRESGGRNGPRLPAAEARGVTLLEAIDVLIVHLGDDTPSTPKTERARVTLRDALRYYERTRQMSTDTRHTIAAGLPLTSDVYSKPPLNIPGDDGRPYKTELVLERSPERTVKINWWHAPDDAGSRARPHNHPWDFTSTVLHGAITHTRYLSGSGGTPEAPRILTTTETIRAGESYTVKAYEYHLVAHVEPGTVTRMECGPLGGTEPPGESWGYLDTMSGEHVPATPDPEFRARLAAVNPWMAAK